MHRYRKKTIKALIIIMLVFLGAFLLGIHYLRKGVPIVDIGISASLINWIVVILSLLFILRVLWEISRVENAKEYEKSIVYKNF